MPLIFRRPIAYVNLVPFGYFFTFLKDSVLLAKNHWALAEGRFLSLREIVDRGVAFTLVSEGYAARGVELRENTPEEIRDVVLEMMERLEGTWSSERGDDELQRSFWQQYPIDARSPTAGFELHREIRATHSTHYLRKNPWWVGAADGT